MAETTIINGLNDDNQDFTEGGDSLGIGGAGSSVSGPSLDTVVKRVGEAIRKTPYEAPGADDDE